jgi:hypothetical protein
VSRNIRSPLVNTPVDRGFPALTGGRRFQVVPELPVNLPETPILIGLVRKTAVDADAM